MVKENKNIKQLCKQIERVLGCEVRKSHDFDALYASIVSKTHQAISISTLKRLFSYVENDSILRRSTLDILCQYAGYLDWMAFCSALEGEGEIESSPLLGDSLSSDAICLDDRIRVTWNPDRECVFRCTGAHHFEVESSVNSKLSEGDTFTCHLFIKGEPLYLEDLVMRSSQPTNYVCGKSGGILFYLN